MQCNSLFTRRIPVRCYQFRRNFRAFRRNFIALLRHEGRDCITQDAKSAALEEYFTKQLGIVTSKTNRLNWPALQLQRHDLGDLDCWTCLRRGDPLANHATPRKSPRAGCLFKTCWDIVKGDIIGVIKEMFALRAAFF
jgi:hypothetical protein